MRRNAVLQATSVPYSVAVNYDTDGHPLTISETGGGQPNTTYELFYDDASHLLAAQITVASATPEYITWNYHYLGSTPFAATRVIQIGTGVPTVKRFWFISDERGLIYRGLDDQGIEYWNTTWDATGWRTINTQSGGSIDMWMPFGLTGQLVLGSTVAYASSGATTHVRPAIAINRQRSYDPLFASFAQPDPSDPFGRLMPEGYVYGRANPTTYFDPSGLDSVRYSQAPNGDAYELDISCDSKRKDIDTAIAAAVDDVIKCAIGLCEDQAGGLAIRRQWLYALATGRDYCANERGSGITVAMDKYHDRRFRIEDGLLSGSEGLAAAITLWWETRGTNPSLTDRITVLARPKDCLARTLAHEALHGVAHTIPSFVSNPTTDIERATASAFRGALPYMPVDWNDDMGFAQFDSLNDHLTHNDILRQDKCVSCD